MFMNLFELLILILWCIPSFRCIHSFTVHPVKHCKGVDQSQHALGELQATTLTGHQAITGLAHVARQPHSHPHLWPVYRPVRVIYMFLSLGGNLSTQKKSTGASYDFLFFFHEHFRKSRIDYHRSQSPCLQISCFVPLTVQNTKLFKKNSKSSHLSSRDKQVFLLDK